MSKDLKEVKVKHVDICRESILLIQRLRWELDQGTWAGAS